MAGIRRLEMLCCALFASLTILSCSSSLVDADWHSGEITWGPNDHSGFAGGDMIVVTENGTLSYEASGTVPFSILVMTWDNWNRSELNQSYAYSSELSVINVTSADVEASIAPGVYWAMVYMMEPGCVNITDLGFSVIYPSSSSDIDIPWGIVAIVIITASIASLSTYVIIKRRNEKG